MDQLNSNTDIISRKRGKHLSLDERGAIQVLHSQGQSLRAIAAKIGYSGTHVKTKIDKILNESSGSLCRI